MAPFPTLTVCTSFVFARSSCVLVSMIQPIFVLSLSLSYKQPVVSLSLGNSFSVSIFALEIIMFCLFAFFCCFFCCFSLEWGGVVEFGIWSHMFGPCSCFTSFNHDRKADIKVSTVIWFSLMCEKHSCNKTLTTESNLKHSTGTSYS